MTGALLDPAARLVEHLGELGIVTRTAIVDELMLELPKVERRLQLHGPWWRVAARGDLRVRRDKAEENEALECKQSNRGQATGIRVPSMGDHACSPAQIGVSPCAGKMRCQPDGDNTQFGGVVITFQMALRRGAFWFEFLPS